MTAILDTSFLFALTDQSDRNHQRVLAVAQRTNERLVLPVVVLHLGSNIFLVLLFTCAAMISRWLDFGSSEQ
jgi:predicted nucleic acid-binding protein